MGNLTESVCIYIAKTFGTLECSKTDNEMGMEEWDTSINQLIKVTLKKIAKKVRESYR